MTATTRPTPRRGERVARNIGKVISFIGFVIILATILIALTWLWKRL